MVKPEDLANVKAVLFGNQKQANVINQAVVNLVAQYLFSLGSNMSTEESTVDAIYTALKESAEYGINDKNAVFIQLVAGPKSYQVLKDGVPYIISHNQPSLDSPKYNFRILVAGEEDVDVQVEGGEPIEKTQHYEKPAAAPDEVLDPNDSIAEQTRKLKDAILPMVPDSFKDEIQDEYAQALSCAKAYFEYYTR